MKRFIQALCLIVVCSMGLSSCLKGNDTEVTVYQETAIVSMSISAVNRYIHTLSKTGKDSVYKKTLGQATTPVFVIDQAKYEIYNPDSLPNDADLEHVKISMTGSTRSGTIFIHSLDEKDALELYSSSDSIDFRTPRTFRVYNNNLTIYRDYKVTVNKHQVATEKILWEERPLKDYPDSLDKLKAKWETIVKESGLDRFIGAGSHEAFAYDKDRKLMVSKDKGKTWAADELDSDASLLPVYSYSFVTYPLTTNLEDDCHLLIGLNGDHPEACGIWRKIAEFHDSQSNKWTYMPLEAYNRYYLPATQNLALVWFNFDVLAITTNNIYSSSDGGITWKKDSRYPMPNKVTEITKVDALVDIWGYLWLKDVTAGKVWRGTYIQD